MNLLTIHGLNSGDTGSYIYLAEGRPTVEFFFLFTLTFGANQKRIKRFSFLFFQGGETTTTASAHLKCAK